MDNPRTESQAAEHALDKSLAIPFGELDIFARCREQARRQPPVVFIHIPRTGGTSFRRVLAYNCHQWFGLGLRPPRETIPPQTWQLYFEDAGPPNPPAPPWNVAPLGFSGHITLGHPFFRTVRHPYAAITLLRDPVERMISHYAFHKALPSSWSSGFTEAIRRDKLDAVAYCARFCGAEGGVLHEFQHFLRTDDDKESVERAVANLRSGIAVFGFTDRMSEFVALLGMRLGFQDVLPARPRNAAALESIAVSIDAVQRAELKRLLALDVEFVRHAGEIYGQRLRGL